MDDWVAGASAPAGSGEGSGVGREDLGKNYYGLIECAGLEHAPQHFGRAVAARPSILWWFADFPVVFAANRVNRSLVGKFFEK
jgi:hypothetical protein